MQVFGEARTKGIALNMPVFGPIEFKLLVSRLGEHRILVERIGPGRRPAGIPHGVGRAQNQRHVILLRLFLLYPIRP